MHEMEVTILEYFLYLIVLYPIIILFFGQFSPGVIYALEHGIDCLTETQRREFVRDICTDKSSNGVYFLNKKK
jgi:hypothetical protein